MEVDVISAGDGEEALALAQEYAAALAIVDINLPDMDGFEVMRRLRTIPHMQDVPIIVFTARNQPGDEVTAYEAGAVDFLYKPFSTQELRDLIKSHLNLA
jgi:putative two-component system response regulator